MANSFTSHFYIGHTYTEVSYTDYGSSASYTCTSEPVWLRYERMCRDSGRVLFGNILTAD